MVFSSQQTDRETEEEGEAAGRAFQMSGPKCKEEREGREARCLALKCLQHVGRKELRRRRCTDPKAQGVNES